MTEQIKTPDKELSDTKIANLSDAEFKALVIRMLRQMIEYGCKIKEVKAIQSELRENIQGTNNEGKEARIQVNNSEQKEEINMCPEEKEQTRIQKNEEQLRNL